MIDDPKFVNSKPFKRMVPEVDKNTCTCCGYIHPPPKNSNCPSKDIKTKEDLEISNFCQALFKYLKDNKNSKNIMKTIQNRLNLMY